MPIATPKPASPDSSQRVSLDVDAQFKDAKTAGADSWGCLPTLAIFKPESVSHLKSLDRWVRMFMPLAFISYCVCMYSTAHYWDPKVVSPLSAVESCAD